MRLFQILDSSAVDQFVCGTTEIDEVKDRGENKEIRRLSFYKTDRWDFKDQEVELVDGKVTAIDTDGFECLIQCYKRLPVSVDDVLAAEAAASGSVEPT